NGKLDSLVGVLTLNGDGGTDALVIREQGGTLGRTYAITGSTVTRSGGPTMNYGSIESFAVNGGRGDDTPSLKAAPAGITASFNGGAGFDTLIAGDAKNTWWIRSVNGGTLNGSNAFTNVETLVGGADADVFQFTNGMSVTGAIDGGGGTDTLDY